MSPDSRTREHLNEWQYEAIGPDSAVTIPTLALTREWMRTHPDWRAQRRRVGEWEALPDD